jgi:uncharacterized protein YndB with AHSA1/START domain
MDDVQVERTVDLDAPVDEVWSALTEDDALSDWFEADVTLEVVPGGGGRFEHPDGEVRRALVEEVDPGRRLSFRWWTDGDDDGPISSVTFELTEAGDRTHLVVTERALLLPVVAATMSADLRRGVGRLELRCAAGRAFAPATLARA